MSCLMRAFAHCSTETTWAQDFFFLSSVFFFFMCVSAPHWLQLLASATNFLVRELLDNLQVATSPSALPVFPWFSFVRGEHAGNLQLLSWSLNEEWFHFRNLRLARQRKAEKFLAAKSECSLCFTSQQSRNKRSAICLFLDSVSNYIDVCVFRAIFQKVGDPVL